MAYIISDLKDSRKVKRTITFGLLLIAGLICSFISDEQKERIRFILVESDANAFNESGEAFNLHTYTKVAFYKQYRVYVYPTIREFYKEIGKTVTIIDDRTEEYHRDMLLERQDTIYHYVVIKECDRYGLKYDSLAKKGKFEKIEIDSLLANRGIIHANYLIYNHPIIGNPVEVIRNDAGKVIMEKFVVPKTEDRHPDSVYRYYDDRLKDIDFSFIPELDKKHDSKAVKLSLVFKPIPKGKLPYDIPRREPYWEMKKFHEENPQDYLNLIERFKRDSKTMNLNID